MKRWALGLALFLAAAIPAAAQTRTLVTGTITDPNHVPYTGATLQALLVASGSPSLTPCTNNVTGCPIQQAAPATTLGPGGSFSLSLWANASILPSGSTYTFVVTISPGVPPPLGTGPQSCSVTGVTIAGASQSLTSTFLNVCPALTAPTASAQNYLSSYISAGSTFSSASPATITSITTTAPATGCPCRLVVTQRVYYYWTSGGTNGIESWVTDGTNPWASKSDSNYNCNGSPYCSVGATETSEVSYANGTTITVTQYLEAGFAGNYVVSGTYSGTKTGFSCYWIFSTI